MQTKKQSITEVIVGTATGYIVATTAQVIIFPLYGIHISSAHTLQIGAIFTGISIIRGYVVRRIFNTLFNKDTIKINQRGAYYGTFKK